VLSLAGAVVKLSDLRGPRFGLLPIVWVGILLSVFQQFVGINVIFYYSTTLWRAVGFSEDRALLISVITSVTNILTTLRLYTGFAPLAFIFVVKAVRETKGRELEEM